MLQESQLEPWSILHFEDFVFENGTSKNKYGVVVSNAPECYFILFFLTTSQVEKYTKVIPDEDYITIPKGAVACFQKDTIIFIDNSNLKKNDQAFFLWKAISYQGKLPQELLEELLQKSRNSKRIPKVYRDIL